MVGRHRRPSCSEGKQLHGSLTQMRGRVSRFWAAPRETPTSNDVSRHEGTPSRERMTRNYSRSRGMRLYDSIVTTVTSRAFGSFTLK